MPWLIIVLGYLLGSIPTTHNTTVTIRHTKLGCEHSAVRWLPLHEYSTKDIRMHEATRKQIKAAYCYVFGYKISPYLKKEIC